MFLSLVQVGRMKPASYSTCLLSLVNCFLGDRSVCGKMPGGLITFSCLDMKQQGLFRDGRHFQRKDAF